MGDSASRQFDRALPCHSRFIEGQIALTMRRFPPLGDPPSPGLAPRKARPFSPRPSQFWRPIAAYRPVASPARQRRDYGGVSTRQGAAGEGSLGGIIIEIRYGCSKSLSEVAQPQTNPPDALDCLLAAAKSLLIS